VFCGAFVADANVLTITQCSIDENSMFSVRNRTNGTVQIGGFVGRGYYTDIYIKRSKNASTVISDSSNLFTYAGGFVGLISPYSVLEILECENSGNVKGYYAGGILGFAGDFAYVGDTHVNVTNAVNTGIIEGANVGGIIGMVSNNSAEYTADLVIMNCISAGSIIANDLGGGLVSFICSATTTIKNNIISATITLISDHGVISDIAVWLSNEHNVTVIEKCYSLHIISDEYCISCTPYQLNSKEFYTETLGWNEDIWDFSELDMENGKYPKLKQ
jgi:hypothetical protein